MNWRDIPGHPGYQVSDTGDVWSDKTNRVLKPWSLPGPRPYKMVWLGARQREYVHALVLLAFVGERPDRHDCMHLNGDASDNRLENLAYGTRSENLMARVDHGTANRGEKNGGSKLTEDAVRDIRSHPVYRGALRDLADKHGVPPATIWAVRARKTWTWVA